MKKLYTLLSLVLFSGLLSAQYYQLPFVNAGQNPGGLNMDPDQTAGYMLANSTGYSQVLNSGDTDWSASETLPFSFTFNGMAYNSIQIAPTGVVTFSTVSGAGPGTNVALPTTDIPDNSICAWGLNLSGANDGVIVKTHGTAPNRQYWVTWASASWAQGGGWSYWSIALEETTNKIYVIDARNYVSSGTGVALTAGIQFTSTSAMSVTGSPALGATNEASGGSDVGPLDNSYYAFIPGTQPDYDGSMSNIDLPNYLKLGNGGTTVTGTLTNLGAQTITDVELTYTVDGMNPVTGMVNGLSIAPGTSAIVSHPTKWDPSTEGTFNVELWASMINANPDANPADDKDGKDVITYTSSYPRVVLYETFTSSTCPPCVPGNINFEGIVTALPDSVYASVKYQMSWPGAGDPYNTADGNDRRTYYGVNSVPSLQVDGGWDGNSGSFTKAIHDDAAEVPAFVQLDASYSIDVDNQTVRTCVTLNAMQDLGAADLHMAITEGETFNNTGTNGETEFVNVLKKMVPSSAGQAVTITNGMNQTICEDYVFQGDYRLPNNASDLINDATEHSVEEFVDLKVVVWVEANSVVYNAANASEGITSVTEVAKANFESFSVFPNPAANNTNLAINSDENAAVIVRVFDITGKTVSIVSTQVVTGSNRIELNTKDLTNGVYFVEVSSDSKTSTQKLVIQK